MWIRHNVLLLRVLRRRSLPMLHVLRAIYLVSLQWKWIIFENETVKATSLSRQKRSALNGKRTSDFHSIGNAIGNALLNELPRHTMCHISKRCDTLKLTLLEITLKELLNSWRNFWCFADSYGIRYTVFII